MKLHTGDTVVVTTGKDKGKTGSILRVLETENRVVVSGVNIRTKHIKKNYQEAGRIIHFEASMDASNVMLIDPKTKKRSRVGYKVDAQGKKARISKVSGEVVVAVKAKKMEKKKDAKAEKKSDVAEAKPSGEKTAEAKPTRQPFWRKKGAATKEGEVVEGSHMKQDHTIPDQQIHVRSGGRGS